MIKASLLVHPDELSKKWIDRMKNNGIGTVGIHPVGGTQAHLSLLDLTERLNEKEYRSLFDYAAERGMKIEYEMHAARYLLPADEFDLHPEWFRQNSEGERTPDFNCCASNSKALDYIAESAARLAKNLYKSTDRYFFWLDDGRDIHCHCPECRELSPSDQQLKILNHMLARLKQDNENAELAYLAYCDTIQPPTKIKPERGIFLEYAPYARDFHAPIEHNAQAESISALLDFFGKDGAKVLDYWYDNSYYSGYRKPPKAFAPDKAVIAADLKFYTDVGFSDISGFACYLGEDYEELHGEPDIGDLGEFLKNHKPLDNKLSQYLR